MFQAFHIYVFQGTFSDFWKGDEDKNFPRLDGPFLDKAMWSEVLQHSGFNGLDFFLDDYTGQPAVTTLVATAVDPNKVCPSPASTDMEELTIVTQLILPPCTKGCAMSNIES